MKLAYQLALVLTSLYRALAWIQVVNRRPPFTCVRMVDALSVEGVENHEAVGERLAVSVQKWLDAEWMPQKVHSEMGHSVKKSYIRSRTAGQTDLMTIMMKIAEDLEQNWAAYDADAFCNAWDIANYVSDYLTAETGSEGCECSSKLY